MLTSEIRNQIDQIWNAFWSGGISNPLEVIEQITYLMFIKRLDELQTLEELKATRLKQPIERRLFPEGDDGHPRSPRPYADYRWSRFKPFAPADMYTVVGEHVFPFLRTRFAEVLDRAEALRAKRRAALAQLDSLIQSIFLDLFGDTVSNPKGWPCTQLGKVLFSASDDRKLVRSMSSRVFRFSQHGTSDQPGSSGKI